MEGYEGERVAPNPPLFPCIWETSPRSPSSQYFPSSLPPSHPMFNLKERGEKMREVVKLARDSLKGAGGDMMEVIEKALLLSLGHS